MIVFFTNTDIDRGIEICFNNFLIDNPIIKENSDNDTLNLWTIFIAYCYCLVNQTNYHSADDFLEDNPNLFNGEVTSLMKSGIEECINRGEDYYTDHVEDLMDDEMDDSSEAYEMVDIEMRNLVKFIETEQLPYNININKFKALCEFNLNSPS